MNPSKGHDARAEIPFEDLVSRHGPELHTYLWRLTHLEQDAEDCLQDTFLRAYRAYPRLRPRSNVRAWLYAIATNVARTHMRRERRRAARRSHQGLERLPAVESDLPDAPGGESLRAVQRAVEALPSKQRAALILRRYQGLNYREIGQALGCSPEAARANAYQALRKLRAQFKEQEMSA